MQLQRRKKEEDQAKAEAEAGRTRAQRAEKCRDARVAYDELLNVQHLYHYDEKGERVYMTDEERPEQIEKAKKAIAENCDSN
jgi:hypothetical protein